MFVFLILFIPHFVPFFFKTQNKIFYRDSEKEEGEITDEE